MTKQGIREVNVTSTKLRMLATIAVVVRRSLGAAVTVPLLSRILQATPLRRQPTGPLPRRGTERVPRPVEVRGTAAEEAMGGSTAL